MKEIAFKQSASKKIYGDYIKRIKRMASGLAKEDSTDILMEFNSHIYEGMGRTAAESEVDNLMSIIEKLGAPEEVLKPLVAEKKLHQATRTFNPLHVFKAIVLNISNGISYVIFAILYLLLAGFGFLVYAKLANPETVGNVLQRGFVFSLWAKHLLIKTQA